MKFDEIKLCLRCNTENILCAYPIVKCQDCGTIMATDGASHSNKLLLIKFDVGSYHVGIYPKSGKTYINGLTMLDVILPFDVTEDKVKSYLLFS